MMFRNTSRGTQNAPKVWAVPPVPGCSEVFGLLNLGNEKSGRRLKMEVQKQQERMGTPGTWNKEAA